MLWNTNHRLSSVTQDLDGDIKIGEFLALPPVVELIVDTPFFYALQRVVEEARNLGLIYHDMKETQDLIAAIALLDMVSMPQTTEEDEESTVHVQFVPPPDQKTVATLGSMIEPVVEHARHLIRGGRVIRGPQIPVPVVLYSQLKQSVQELEAFVRLNTPTQPES